MEQITKTENGLLVRAPAKINLSLLIAGKRSDGFHEIETVMAKVDLYDELVFEFSDKEGFELVCQGKYWAPDGRDNLVYQACKMLCDTAKVTPNVKITLTKNIPPGSGLGGGSSDAAAGLIGLNKFAGLGICQSDLEKTAARIGSDVVFFLGSPLAFCTGRGEKIKKIKKNFSFQAILLLPNVNVSTKKVYENYIHNQALFNELSNRINPHIREKKIDLIAKMCANMLLTSCFGLYQELADLKSRIEALGINPVGLSGSGSAMYYLAGTDENSLEHYQSMLRSIDCESVIVNNNRW